MSGQQFLPSCRTCNLNPSCLTSRRSQPPLARSVPLARFTPRVGGGSAFFVRRIHTMNDIEARKTRQEIRTLMGAYAGFQMATVLVVISNAADIPGAYYIVSLFAIGIPSSVAHCWFTRPSPEDEKRIPGSLMAVSFCLAYMPSLAAISLLLASASIFASVAFLVTCL